MLAPKTAKAAALRDAGGDPKNELLGRVLIANNKDTSPDLQRLRASWLMRRCCVDAETATLIAHIVMGEVRT